VQFSFPVRRRFNAINAQYEPMKIIGMNGNRRVTSRFSWMAIDSISMRMANEKASVTAGLNGRYAATDRTDDIAGLLSYCMLLLKLHFFISVFPGPFYF